MRAKEQKRARLLRENGWSVRAIAKKLGCSKGSVSVWVRGIELTPEQIEKLESAQAKARAKAANHPNGPKLKWARFRENIIANAHKEIPPVCSLETLKFIGAALYWAEGYNATRCMFVFANTDPAMIKLMMIFLKKICKVPMTKLRGGVNIHPHLDVKQAEKHWSLISGIPLSQFHKSNLAVSRASKQKRWTLPYGTFRIIISDVALCSRIKGWIEGMKGWAVSSVG